MIIAISGKKQSGKDTVAKIIQYLLNQNRDKITIQEWLDGDCIIDSNWQIKKFAGKIKECVSVITGIPIDDLEKEEVKNTILFPRWFIYHYKMRFKENPEGRVSEYFATAEEAKEALNARGRTFFTGCDITSQNVTIRILLQELGTEVGRGIYSNLWIWSLFNDYKTYTRTIVECDDNGINYVIPEGHGKHSGTICDYPVAEYDHEPRVPNWIITDCRFPNELRACKEHNAITIRVNREGLMQDNHISETALDNATFDYYLNNTTIEQLVKYVETILKMEELL